MIAKFLLRSSCCFLIAFATQVHAATFSGIDLHWAMQCRLENVFINTDIYNVQSAQPTHGTKGLITPVSLNAALTILRNVIVTGKHRFQIEQLNTENSGPGQTDEKNVWQKTLYDVNDPSNRGTADINYCVVVGNVGTVADFKVKGGSGIRTRRIGAAP